MDPLTAGAWFDALPVATVVLDEGLRVVRVNRAGRRLLGGTLDGPLSAYVDDEDRSVHDQQLRRLGESGEPCSWEVRLHLPGEPATRVRIDAAMTAEGAILLGLRDTSHERARRDQLLLYQRQLRSLAARLMRSAEEERRRVARDLHDGLGEALSLLELKTDTLAASALDTPQADLVAEVRALLDDVGEKVNTLVFRLSPPVLRQVGLAAAIRWLGGQLREDQGLTVTLSEENVPPLSQELRGFLFRAVRELLHNAAKHADTQEARVRLQGREGWLDVDVVDEGRGFDPEAVARGDHRFGLFSLREEISYLGGSCDIRSADGEGTRVRIGVPLQENAS